MGEKITPVKNITSSTHDWKAKVQGIRVQAIIYEGQIDKFEDIPEVFKSYYISNAMVKSVQEKYRIVPNEWQWTINANDNPPAHDFFTFDKLEKHVDKQTEIGKVNQSLLTIRNTQTHALITYF
ncbi:hypothetical protein HYC85_032363 [Camellia sinensis]|uniref:Uncharacterized protein n=1 Tax=Camellia sinensis TaxID=4442 RepID=A0A7J7FSX8_CAMSI|nr:hypothetical protein HYC85_032363 [Camellia sinensis]